MNNTYSLLKIFHVFNFRRVTPVTKNFSVEFFPNYGIPKGLFCCNINAVLQILFELQGWIAREAIHWLL